MSDMHGSQIGLFERIHNFVVAGASHELTDELWADFERLLRESDDACRLYLEYVDVSVVLPTILSSIPDGEFPSPGLFSPEQQAVPFSAPTFQDNIRHGIVGYFSSDWPVAHLVTTVIFGIGLLIGSHIYLSHPVYVANNTRHPASSVVEPKMEFVGRITGTLDCKWTKDSVPLLSNDAVSLGREFKLESGLVEIGYNTGATVILQGPCTYEAESRTGGFLSVGKLTARLEKKGNDEGKMMNDESRAQGSDIHPSSFILHPLFSVRTPTATVTDLGTEFGVEVSKEGDTTSCVFRGSVELRTIAGDGKSPTVARVLHENESARVEPPGGKHDASRLVVLLPTFAPSTFVREIPKLTIKTLDLVDVVAGGDGFSGRRGRGIDPTDGQVVDTPLKDATGKQSREINVLGDGQYHRVEGLPYVDGVFIPDGRNSPVQISSADHTFAGFLNASYTTAMNVWAGGAVPTERPPSIRTELEGIDYASPGHGLLFLHANKGITFDMRAMRQANPNERPVRFRAVVGNTETDSDRGYSVYADVWVFVDGAARFRRRQINSSHGAFSVVVPIGRQDRFLTLVATDGGDTIAGDWILFGDPRLELVPVQTTAGSVSEKTP